MASQIQSDDRVQQKTNRCVTGHETNVINVVRPEPIRTRARLRSAVSDSGPNSISERTAARSWPHPGAHFFESNCFVLRYHLQARLPARLRRHCVETGQLATAPVAWDHWLKIKNPAAPAVLGQQAMGVGENITPKTSEARTIGLSKRRSAPTMASAPPRASKTHSAKNPTTWRTTASRRPARRTASSAPASLAD